MGFYGGKQGRTYHIVERYDCVDLNNYAGKGDFISFQNGTSYTKGQKIVYDNEYYVVLTDSISSITDLSSTEEKVYHVRGMVQQFAKGGAYTNVNYGEYVLIDTIFNLNHKSDLENGLLYRRGFDYNQSIKTKPDINDYYDANHNLEKDLWQSAWESWVQKPGAGAIYVGQIVGPQGDSPEVIPVAWNEIKDNSSVKKVIPVSNTMGNDSTIVKDNDGNDVWNGDTIKVASVTLKDSDGNTTGAKIAFDIPNMVMQTRVINHDPYSTAGVVEDNSSSGHPFWYKWNFTIPDGKHGADLNGLVIETGIETGESKDANGNSIVNEDEYLTYSIRDYTTNAAGVVSEHLGRWPYRVINDIYLTSNERTFITFEEGVTAKIGDLYSFGDIRSPEGNLICAVCIREGNIDSNTSPTIKADGDTIQYRIGTQSWSGDSKWRVIEISYTAPASSMTVDYTAGENTLFTNKLRNVDFLTVDELGDLYVKYSDIDQYFKLTNINGLSSVETSNSGITLHYTNNTSDFIPIKQIKSIKLQNQDDIEESQKFIAEYKDGTIQEVSDALNTILAIEMQGDNIVALYSDPNYRDSFENKIDTIENKDYFKRDWTDPVTGVSYTNLTWINLTSPKGSYHVQGEYTYSDLKGDSTAQDFTTDLSNGFGNVPNIQNREGWLVTVDDNGTRKIYAFDYNDKTSGKYTFPDNTPTHWYEIFSLSASAIEPELSVIIESYINPPINKLNNNGLWFVTYPGHDNI